MSRAYTSNGKRCSSQTHARRDHTCPCGRVVFGNGGWSSHKRACTVYQAARALRGCGHQRCQAEGQGVVLPCRYPEGA